MYAGIIAVSPHSSHLTPHPSQARLEYLRDRFQIRENDFLTFDAMRHAAQVGVAGGVVSVFPRRGCVCVNTRLSQYKTAPLNMAGVFDGLWELILVLNHNHYTTAKSIYSVAQEREIEGMFC